MTVSRSPVPNRILSNHHGQVLHIKLRAHPKVIMGEAITVKLLDSDESFAVVCDLVETVAETSCNNQRAIAISEIVSFEVDEES